MITENIKPIIYPLLKSSDDRPDARIRIKSEKKFGLEEERFILCANCGHAITMPESIITVDGKHIHEFTNPAGLTYEIGCFSSADGCTNYGEPTLDHTWFEGFGWSFSVCSNCFTHLGWFYTSGDESFYGLILDLLTDTASTQ